MKKNSEIKRKNVCLFSLSNDTDNYEEYFNVINTVYEREHLKTDFTINTVFKMVVIIKGKGNYITTTESKSVKKGDVFIIFPGTTQKISNEKDLEYAYVSFMSVKAYNLLAQLGIHKNNFFRLNSSSFIKIWQEAFSKKVSLSLYSEGLINITLSYVTATQTKILNPDSSFADALFKTFDQRFTDSTFNLNELALELNYTPNYLSSVFKKYTGQSFQSYLTYKRLQKALSLFHAGYSQIKQISFLCGYSDPLYFSKVFKKHTSYSPTEYAKKVKRNEISGEI